MNDVKWIKITTNMFDNRKIKHLRKLPAGNDIVLIWVMLLTMAGRCNSGGMIFLTENIPYTTKMLADELGFEENVVIMALKALEELDMITRDSNYLMVPGWEEYQAVDGLERIREQNRKRVQKYREKQKMLTCNVTVTESNAIEEEKELKKDIDKKENTKRKRFVPPTLKQVDEYCKEKGFSLDSERFIDYYESNGWMVGKNKMKDWKAAVRNWERQGRITKPSAQRSTNRFNNFEQREYDYEQLEKELLEAGRCNND